MNKNIIFLSLIALVLLTALNVKYFLKNKNELSNELENKIEFEKKAKTILVLKNALKNRLYLVKNICQVQNNLIECKNLDKNKFSQLNYAIKYLNIKKFDIKKNKNFVNVHMEIE